MSTLVSKLVLLPYMCKVFGYNDVGSMIEDLERSQKTQEHESSKYLQTLLENEKCDRRIIKLLPMFNKNINDISVLLESKRGDLNWKPFQYCCLLFVEYYLFRYFNNKDNLIDELNNFSISMNSNLHYNLEHITKVCIQSATGSGKTLLLHANIIQYKKYLQQAGLLHKLNKIILLTPDENMSVQHIKELQKSGFGARRFSDTAKDLFESGGIVVDVIDIHKIDNKKGVTRVAVQGFGKNNLILVDEGHLGGTIWRGFRDKMVNNGFCFEYSATFTQAMKTKKSLIDSYGKNIIFDYSYPKYYNEGYGKDYIIHNLKNTNDDTDSQMVLLACMVSFYQQCEIFYKHYKECRIYNIEKPLCVFLGRTVKNATSNDDETRSDVNNIVKFISWLLNDTNRQEVLKRINNIISGKLTVLTGSNEVGMLDFSYIKNLPVDAIYENMLQKVFLGLGNLRIAYITGTDELHMSAGTNRPFGIIKIGDPVGFYKDIKISLSHESDFYEDRFSSPMFSEVDKSSSSVMLAVGARKFVAGWNSWRVSTMGLMHVGQKEGPQIIQMFGRGVRLKGYGMSMKRHSFVKGESITKETSQLLKKMETLNIFGIKANYMEEFRKYTSEMLEGQFKQHAINTKTNALEQYNLKLIQSKSKQSFYSSKGVFDLEVPTCNSNKIEIKRHIQLQSIASTKSMETEAKLVRRTFTTRHIKLFDNDRIYHQILENKFKLGWDIMLISQKTIDHLINDNEWYIIETTDDFLEFDQYSKIVNWETTMVELIVEYAKSYWLRQRGEWSRINMEIMALTSEHPNILDKIQLVSSNEENKKVVNKAMTIIAREIHKKTNPSTIVEVGQNDELTGIFYNLHAYEPLLHTRNTDGNIRILPDALNEGELDFVKSLIEATEEETKINNTKIYFMRNLSRGHGVHIYTGKSEYYPDFIVWLLEKVNKNEKQHIIFIDPKGLVKTSEETIAKIDFHEQIKETQKELNATDNGILLHSYIWCVSKSNDLLHPKKEYINKGVYFKEDGVQGVLNLLTHAKNNP